MQKPTVLCIDDEESELKVRRLLLQAQGYRVLTALDGPAGIHLFKSQPIDAVILDYSMPKMDGGVVATTLKQLRPHVPIIMLSGHGTTPTAAKHSIDAFVAKGQAPAVLLATTASLLNIRSHSHPELDGQYVAFADENRRYLDVTDGVCELLGYSRDELLTMTVDDVTAPKMLDNVAPLFHRYLADGRQEGEYLLLSRRGKEIPINYIARVFPDNCMVARWEVRPALNKDQAA